MSIEGTVPRQPVTVLPDSIFVTGGGTPVPIYHELASKLEHAIVAGDIGPGSRLEDEVSLAQRLNVSRPTVRRAFQVLVDKGLLVRRRGIGTLVVPPPTLSRKLELTSLWDDLARRGKHPTTTVLSSDTVDADSELAVTLGIEVGAPLLRLSRLRMADGVPLAILQNYLPAPHSNLDIDDLEVHGLYDVLGRRGVTIRVAHQAITARAASSEEAEVLTLSSGDPLLLMIRTAYDASGRAVEYGEHLYRPDLYAFETTLTRS